MDKIEAGAAIAAGLARTRLDQAELWMRYFAVGGSCSYQSLREYLAGGTGWSPFEHDIAVLALNEYFLENDLGPSIGYSRRAPGTDPGFTVP